MAPRKAADSNCSSRRCQDLHIGQPGVSYVVSDAHMTQLTIPLTELMTMTDSGVDANMGSPCLAIDLGLRLVLHTDSRRIDGQLTDSYSQRLSH